MCLSPKIFYSYRTHNTWKSMQSSQRMCEECIPCFQTHHCWHLFCLFKWSDPRWLGLTNLNGGAIRMQRQTSARSLWTGEISNISFTFRAQTICELKKIFFFLLEETHGKQFFFRVSWLDKIHWTKIKLRFSVIWSFRIGQTTFPFGESGTEHSTSWFDEHRVFYHTDILSLWSRRVFFLG